MQIIPRVRIWTENEDNYIRNNYLNMTDEEIGNALSRSPSAIKNERLKLGIKRNRQKKSGYKKGEILSFEKLKQMFDERDYILLSSESEYKAQSSKLSYICKKHEDKGIQQITVSHFKNNEGCWYCGRERTANSRRSTVTENEDRLLCESKDFQYIKTEKIDGKYYIFFICNKHRMLGIQKMTRGNMNRAEVNGCQYCSHKNLPHWYIKYMIESKYPNIEVLSEYKGMNKELQCYCNIHEEYFSNIAKEILYYGRGCRGCYEDAINVRAQAQKLSKSDIEERINLGNPDFELIDASNYIDYGSKLTIKCKKCNNIFSMSLYDLRNNKWRCPNCSKDKRKMSYGEFDISNFLQDININFEYQYRINECKDKRTLPFDFGILNDKLQLIGLIEYQGEQHYHPVKYFGGEKKFKETQRRDLIKKNYCTDNNIPLLIIPYWDYDKINELVKQFVDTL